MAAIAFVLLFLAITLWVVWPEREAVRLHLELHTMSDLNIVLEGAILTATIAPTAANGKPAPVTDVAWSADNANVTLAPLSDDPKVCHVTGVAVGVSNLTVTAKAKSGNVLTATGQVTVQVDEEAVALNLSIA